MDGGVELSAVGVDKFSNVQLLKVDAWPANQRKYTSWPIKQALAILLLRQTVAGMNIIEIGYL